MPNDVAHIAFDTLPEAYQPTHADVINSIGADFFRKGELEPARLHFLAALSADPKNAMALQNLGAVLRQMGHYAAAESCARRSYNISKSPLAMCNMGVAMLHQRRFGEATHLFKEALRLAPERHDLWHNFGLTRYMVGAYQDALAAFDKCIAFGFDHPTIASDKSLALLSMGEIQKGLELYECRWKTLWIGPVWEMNIPEWKGEALDGKHILCHHEQGFGDTLMLVRFVRDLVNQGATVTLAVPKELQRVLEGEYATVVAWDDPSLIDAKQFDYHSPLLSTMRWLGIKKPEDIKCRKYITAKLTKPVKLPEAKFRVGLVWASGQHGPEMVERRRVVPLTHFLPLLEMDGLALVSLQMGESLKDIANCGLEGLVYDTSYRIEDFADTAEIIHHLDVVISVDSAVAHLAGAMGKPVIMLSPYTRCWRWWSNNSGWPWYDNMRQFHQAQDGSWYGAVEKAISTVRGDMRRYVEN